MGKSLLAKAIAACQEQNWSSAQDYLYRFITATELEPKESFPATDEGNQELAAIAIDILRHGSFDDKWNVSKLIPKLAPGIKTDLIRIAQDTEIDIDCRWFAIRSLASFQDVEVVLCLLELIKKTPEEQLQQIAAEVISHLGIEVIDQLTQLLAEPNSRLSVMQAFSQMRLPEVIAPTLTVLADSDPHIRALGINILASFPRIETASALIHGLQDHGSEVRLEAVIGLRMMIRLLDQEQLCELLAPLLHDLNFKVCSETAITLGKIKSDQVEIIFAEVITSDLTPLELVLTMIKVLGWRDSESSLNLIGKIVTDGDDRVLKMIAKTLSKVKNPTLKPQAAQILNNLYESNYLIVSKSSTIKQAIAYAAGHLGESINKPLLKILAKDDHPRVRLHSQKALEKLEVSSVIPPP
jgi:HEAT repeat protein